MNTTPTSGGFCAGCGYALRGLTASGGAYRCPECGRAFDPANPKTFRQTPHKALVRWLSRPVGWPIVMLASAAAAGVMLVSRWKPGSFFPSAVDLHYYLRPSALRHRTSLETWRDYVFTLSMPAAIFACGWWLLRLCAGALVRWHANIRADEIPVSAGRRNALLAIASAVTAGAAALGWPYRLAQQWVARRMSIDLKTFPALTIAPPTALTPLQTTATLRAAVIELPAISQRMAGLKLLIEDYAPQALPILIEAVASEREVTVKALELRLIGLHRDPQTVDVLTRFLASPDGNVRAAAADAIGMVHAPAYPVPLSPQWPNGAWESAATIGDDPIILDRLVSLHSDGAGLENLRMNEIRLSGAVRDQLERMMIGGPTEGEREAAARALVPWPPETYKFRVAEWGVWIDVGGQLKILQSLLDEIPPFVHRTGNPVAEFESRINPILAVDKPIIHLTANRPLAADINVIINRGRPWFAYPMPDDFAVEVGLVQPTRLPLGNDIPDKDDVMSFTCGTSQPAASPSDLQSVPRGPRSPPPILAQLDNQNLKRLGDIRQGFPWLTPAHISLGPTYLSGGRSMDHSDVTSLGLRWQSIIVSPSRLPWMGLPQVPSDPKYAWWKRLRDVPSAWVSSRGESERFLYYDGPTLMPAPLTPTLKGGKITLALPKMEAGFYQPDESLPILFPSALLVRCSGPELSAQMIELPDLRITGSSSATITLAPDNIHGQQVIAKFRHMLTTAGLTAEEAEGLIESWRPQFFQTVGARLLLLMSKQSYDRFCPIEICPKPTEVARVGVILTEFGNNDGSLG